MVGHTIIYYPIIRYRGSIWFYKVHLVVEVNAFQWNVRPRWGRNFWKSVRCCVQLVFSMFVFSPIDGLSWVFHGYHADGCSYSLVFWEFCTSLVARSVVQDSYKHRRILGRCYNKCLFFGTSHRHTTLTCHIFLGLPTILPKMKVVAIVYCSILRYEWGYGM